MSFADISPDEARAIQSAGGHARAAALTPHRRKKIAKLGAEAKWERVRKAEAEEERKAKLVSLAQREVPKPKLTERTPPPALASKTAYLEALKAKS